MYRSVNDGVESTLWSFKGPYSWADIVAAAFFFYMFSLVPLRQIMRIRQAFLECGEFFSKMMGSWLVKRIANGVLQADMVFLEEGKLDHHALKG